MMPSNDFPRGNLIYCHREEMEKKDLRERKREGTKGEKRRGNPHQHFIRGSSAMKVS